MGGAAQSKPEDLERMTAAEVANLLREELDEAYKPYADSVEGEGIDANCILQMSAEDLDSVIAEMKPAKAIHKVKLMQKAALLKEQHRLSREKAQAASASLAPAPVPAPAPVSPAPPLHKIPADLLAVDHITRTPRDLLSDLFKIQAIRLSPNRVVSTVERLAKMLEATKHPDFDGKTRYGAFINYRVVADAAAAEQLHLRLKILGIHTFLDKECLEPGYPWKDGFVEGVTKSHFFIALISRDALAPARKLKADHTYDNVLYEYEIALKIRDRMERPDFIIPILIDTASKSEESRQIQYRDFSDFYPTLYSDSITSKAGEDEKLLDDASPALLGASISTSTSVKEPEVEIDTIIDLGCFHGDCTLDVKKGDNKFFISTIASIKKGDVLRNGDVIECILETRLNSQLSVPVVRFEGGLIITPWHPVLWDNEQWRFPAQIGKVTKMKGIGSVFSLLVRHASKTGNNDSPKRYAQCVTVNGVECITLAAGVADDPVATHPFFGTTQVVEAMQKHSPEGFVKGLVVLDTSLGGGLVRDQVTKIVTGFRA